MKSYAKLAPGGRGAYPLLKQVLKLAPAKPGVYTTPHGVRMDLQTNTYPDDAMAFGLYELDTLRLIRKLLKPGGHFVDGGANIGYFTLHAAKFLDRAGRIDSFEPDPLNLGRLKSHLADNGCTNVNLHELALGSSPGTLTLYHPGGSGFDAANHGRASMFQALAPGGQSFSVPVVRLDEVLSSVPTLIKLDIEGAEVPAVNGMQKLLVASTPPMLIVEHNAESAKAAGGTPGDVFSLIQRINPAYRFFWIGSGLKPIAVEQLANTERQGNIFASVTEVP